jgi:hypothetical protein
MTDTPFINSEGIRNRLRDYHDTVGLSWPKISANTEFSPVPAGTLCSIYHGYPVPLKWRKHLGMSEKIKVSGCLHCGKVHTTKRCTSGNHRPRPHRIAVRTGDPSSAAKSIIKHMDEDKVKQLVELLKGNEDDYKTVENVEV